LKFQIIFSLGGKAVIAKRQQNTNAKRMFLFGALVGAFVYLSYGLYFSMIPTFLFNIISMLNYPSEIITILFGVKGVIAYSVRLAIGFMVFSVVFGLAFYVGYLLIRVVCTKVKNLP